MLAFLISVSTAISPSYFKCSIDIPLLKKPFLIGTTLTGFPLTWRVREFFGQGKSGNFWMWSGKILDYKKNLLNLELNRSCRQKRRNLKKELASEFYKLDI
jgi:hypothetical protein